MRSLLAFWFRVLDTDDSLVVEEQATSSCCSSKQPEVVKQSMGEKIVSAVSYGYGRMISDTAKWLAIGLVAATIITTFVPQSFFLQWGNGLMAMIIMVIVGLPMYICATASTPVAASFVIRWDITRGCTGLFVDRPGYEYRDYRCDSGAPGQ